MRASWFRGVAVAAASAVLVVVPAGGALATPGVQDRPGTSEVTVTTHGVAPWVPGAMARVIRAAEASAARWTVGAERLAAERRADALALAHAAMSAAGAAEAVGDAVEPGTVQELADGVRHLTVLLDRASFAGFRATSVTGSLRLPDADVAPAQIRPERDVALADSIEGAAAEVFRLSIQVEVAAREAEVGDPIGGPGDLRAPAALTPLEDEAAADGDLGAAGADPGGADGDVAASADDGDAPAADGDVASGGHEAAAVGADGAPGASQPDAAVADDVADDGADATPDDTADGPAGAEGGTAPAGDDGSATGPASAASDAAANAPAADATAEPATLDALPTDLLEGLAALEGAVAAAGELLAGDIFGLESVPFLTADRARLMALAQGLDAGDVAAWSQWRNGQIPTEELCAAEFAPGSLLRCDAAYALELLNVEYRAEFGEDLGIVSAYRSYEQQVTLKASKGWLAATPGSSNHGWGLAVDLAGMGGLGDYSSPRYRWMLEHGPEFGWHHPRSMRPGGGGPPEPWHFEFGTSAGREDGRDGPALDPH